MGHKVLSPANLVTHPLSTLPFCTNIFNARKVAANNETFEFPYGIASYTTSYTTKMNQMEVYNEYLREYSTERTTSILA